MCKSEINSFYTNILTLYLCKVSLVLLFSVREKILLTFLKCLEFHYMFKMGEPLASNLTTADIINFLFSFFFFFWWWWWWWWGGGGEGGGGGAVAKPLPDLIYYFEYLLLPT